MPIVEFSGKTFEVEELERGLYFLKKFSDWCPEWVAYVQNDEKIDELTEEHKRIMEVLRGYYDKNGIAPLVRALSKTVNMKLKHINELFPSGPANGACRMSGLPRPTGCV